jgi:outer membrane receptor protein involved in Fe transport
MYQSRFYFTETNESILSQSGHQLFNAKIGYETKDRRCSFAVYGKNLTDEEVIDVALDGRQITGTVNYAYQPPRTYGIELLYKY